jgi:hypothetical protein
MRDHDRARAVGGTVASMDERDGSAVDATRIIPTEIPTEIADGDDIEVIPAGPGDPPAPGRRRRLVVALVVAAVVLSALGILFVTRGSATKPVLVATTTQTTLASPPVAAHVKPKATVAPKKPAPTVAAVVTAPSTLLFPSPTPATAIQQVTNPPATAPTTAAAAPPQQFGPSVLTWTAPGSLTIAAGQSKAMSVTAHNPTNGTVTLPHPLACTPRIDNSGMCTEMVQLIGPGQSASAQYMIDATGIAPGHYSMRIEGVLTVSVTVS